MNVYQLYQWRQSIQVYLMDSYYVLREKGVKYFSRTLGVAAVPVFFCYLVSGIPTSKVQWLQMQMAGLEAGAQHADRYKALRQTLQNVTANIPDSKTQDVWLQNMVLETLKQEKITATRFSQPQARSQGGVSIISVNVAFQATYKQLGNWMARVERTKVPLNVSNLALAKKEKTGMMTGSAVGVHSITLTIDMMGAK